MSKDTVCKPLYRLLVAPATHSPRPLLAYFSLAVYRLPALLDTTAICGPRPSRLPQP